MTMKTRSLASGACGTVRMCLLRCVSFGWMCLHILWCMRAYRQNHFTVSPSSKICCFDFMAWSTAIPSLDMFSLLLLFHTAFSLRLFLRSVDLNGMCAFHFSSPILYFLFSTLHLQWVELLRQSLFVSIYFWDTYRYCLLWNHYERRRKGNVNNCGKLSCDEQVFCRLLYLYLYYSVAFNTKPIDELWLSISNIGCAQARHVDCSPYYSAHAERN